MFFSRRIHITHPLTLEEQLCIVAITSSLLRTSLNSLLMRDTAIFAIVTQCGVPLLDDGYAVNLGSYVAVFFVFFWRVARVDDNARKNRKNGGLSLFFVNMLLL